MRRVCILLVALALLAAFVSCNREQPEVPTPTTEQATTEATTPVAATSEETTPEVTTPAVTEPDFENNPDPDGTKRY